MKKLFLVLTTFFTLTTCSVLPAQVTANFGWTVDTMYCGNMQIAFSDSSTGFVTSWFWDFGNGGTFTAQNPFAIYSTGGIYSVTLIVSDSVGNKDTLIQDITIPFPVGSFTFTPTSGGNPLTVCFSANAINTTSYLWNFDDGTLLNSIGDTCHTYTFDGTFYPVLLLQYTLPDGSPCSEMATNLTGDVTVITAGVNEHIENLSVAVFPNPAKSNITIETAENKKFIVHIFNAQGKQIIKQSFQKKTEADVSAYGKGLFLVEVCDEKGMKCHTQKVLIE